ncbi:PREDICTED: sodium- and chloride-dependent glycine transporter 1-like [Priapulus caudatus]|uniref:Sodium- and chloride-dependent glycine transporter 1-like n=1 Tax=Priapulus caudatus TaxID=37621 RepID=A0ABM1EDL0_PRICU|nr:PREDICTED: sodium- and chloride-dependent glycine transporter 1-like [Priapulus caudatus]
MLWYYCTEYYDSIGLRSMRAHYKRHGVLPEMKGRYRWGRGPQFLVACMGLVANSVTLVNFPQGIVQFGFWPFFTAYAICLLVIGLPMIYLEVLLGQFSSSGALGIWRASPLFKGVGICMLIRSALLVVRESGVACYTTYYMFLSMFRTLPWSGCDNTWNTKQCWEGRMEVKTSEGNVTSAAATTDDLFRLGSVKSSPVEEYFLSHVDSGKPDPALGIPRPWIVACLVMLWSLIFVCLTWGIKSLGKVVYVTTILPVVLLGTLLVRGVTLQNGGQSIAAMFATSALADTDGELGYLDHIINYELWYVVGSMVIQSLVLGYGVYAAMASHGSFTHSCLRDSVITALWSFAINICYSVVIFSYSGFYALVWSKDVSAAHYGDYFYIFKVIPDVISRIDVGHLFGICYFLMLTLFFLSTILILVANIETSLCDQFSQALGTFRRRVIFHATICCTLLIAGLPVTTDNGFRVVSIIQRFEGRWQGPLFLCLQCIAFAMIYNYTFCGPRAIYQIIKQMLGRRLDRNIIMDILWVSLTPMVLFLLVFATWWFWAEQDYELWHTRTLEEKVIEIVFYAVTSGFIPLWALMWSLYCLIIGPGSCCEKGKQNKNQKNSR